MIGNWIKKSREEKGLSQNELAELMNTTRQNISHYENGRRESPSIDVLKEFSNVLDLSILIEKGEIIKMKTSNKHIQTIKESKKRLARQFEYTGTITIEELLNQVISLVENEFSFDYPTWRAFIPKDYVEGLGRVDADWETFFKDNRWGRFEFDFELEEAGYIQAISFEIVEKDTFAHILSQFISDDLDEEALTDSVWCEIVNIAVHNAWEDISQLQIKNIQVC